MASVHLKFGGSTAGRTIQCPVWGALYDTLPPAVPSKFANLGNALHDVMEQLLLADEPKPYDFVGFEAHGCTVDRELVATKVEPAWVAWLELCKQYGIDEYEPEVFVRLSEDTGGTIDVLAVTKDNRRILVDFKFGDGVLVHPEGNPQLLFYDACAVSDPAQKDWLEPTYGTDPVYVIIQPTERADEVMHVWETTTDALDAFGGEYLNAQLIAENANPDDLNLYRAGPYCKFCPCEAVCPLKLGLVEKKRRLAPERLATLSEALNVAEEMEQWIAAVRKLAHEQLDRGDKVDGWKLVNKRATRQWSDLDEVERIVKNSKKVKHDETHTSRLLTVAQMEKLYKAKGLDFARLSEYVASISSGTTLAHESDPRPAAVSIQALKALADRTGS